MDTQTVIALTILITLVVGELILQVKKLVKSGKLAVPETAKVWLDKITPQVLIEAYRKALTEAAAPDLRRDIAVGYVKDFVKKSFGLEIPTAIANFLVEYIVVIAKFEGPDVLVKTLGAVNASKTTI